VKVNEQIRVAVIAGQRPDLSVIAGPETLQKFLVSVISRCWHQNMDLRPTFAGMIHMISFDMSFRTLCVKKHNFNLSSFSF